MSHEDNLDKIIQRIAPPDRVNMPYQDGGSAPVSIEELERSIPRDLLSRWLRKYKLRLMRWTLKYWRPPITYKITTHDEFYLERVVPYHHVYDSVLITSRTDYVRERTLRTRDSATGFYFFFYGSKFKPVVRIRWNRHDARAHFVSIRKGRKSRMFLAIKELRKCATDYVDIHKVKIRREFEESIDTLSDEKEVVVMLGSRIAVRIPYNYLIDGFPH